MRERVEERILVDGVIVFEGVDEACSCRYCAGMRAVEESLEVLLRCSPWVCGIDQRRVNRREWHIENLDWYTNGSLFKEKTQ